MAPASDYNRIRNLAVNDLSGGKEPPKKVFDTKVPEVTKEPEEKKPEVLTEPAKVEPEQVKTPEQAKPAEVFKPSSIAAPKTQTFYPGQGSMGVPTAGEVKDEKPSDKITPDRARLDPGDVADLKGQTSVLKNIPTVLVRSIQKLFPDMNQSDACAAFMYMFIKSKKKKKKLDEVPDSVKQNVLQYRGDEITSDTVMNYLSRNFDVTKDQYRDLKEENRELRRQLDALLLGLSYLITDFDGGLAGSKMNFASASVDETYQRLMKDTKKAVQDRKNRDGRAY